MRYAEVQAHCLSLPGATLSIQWGADNVFKVCGKMFAVMGPATQKPHTLSFKAGEDSFHILTRAKHIIPAPYLARAHWVYLERLDALSTRELREYLNRAHAFVVAGLSKKMQATLAAGKNPKKKKKTSARRQRR